VPRPGTVRDSVDFARLATGDSDPGMKQAGVAYSNAKLAILYYAHELRRRVGPGVAVAVFEPAGCPAPRSRDAWDQAWPPREWGSPVALSSLGSARV
jgi:hypothetical protein